MREQACEGEPTFDPGKGHGNRSARKKSRCQTLTEYSINQVRGRGELTQTQRGIAARRRSRKGRLLISIEKALNGRAVLVDRKNVFRRTSSMTVKVVKE